MGILNNFDTKANFWQINPQLCIMEPLKTLYDADKSKSKEDSSKIMWAIALIVDPESKFFNLPLDQRRKLISKDYLQNPKFNFDDYKEHARFYELLSITPAKRQLVIWNTKLDEKTSLLEKMVYSVENAEFLEKLLASNSKLYSELERISEQLVKEGEFGIVKGGSEESISEKGEI